MNLTDEDADIASKLRSYQRKIASMRAAESGEVLPMISEDPFALPSRLQNMRSATAKKRRRARRDALSVAEDYRRARTLQRVLQAVCGVQMACTFVLALLGPVGLLFAVAGVAVGADRNSCILGMRRENWFHYMIAVSAVLLAAGLAKPLTAQ